MTDRLDREDDVPTDVVAALLRTQNRRGAMGCRLHWLSLTSSTNDVAAQSAAGGAEEGTTILADAQTRGRGRYGRSWFSPPGAGLYMSVILRPPADTARAGGVSPAHMLTLASGVAVAGAVRRVTGLPAEIKWPNDVLVGGRKLAGILAEGVSESGRLHFVIVGIGVNVGLAAYPPELQRYATSVEAETNRPADRASLLAEILAALNTRYVELCRGNFDAILSAWRELSPSIRSALVQWDTLSGVSTGRVEDLDAHGALLVRSGGRLHRVVSGEVRLLQKGRGGDAARD